MIGPSVLQLLAILPIAIGSLAIPPGVYAAPPQPQIKIVSPTDGQTIVGQEVTVSFLLGNAAFGSEAVLHLWLDTQTPSASTATTLTSHQDHVLSGLAPGPHTLLLEAVRPDQTSFSPRVTDVSHFVLQQATAPLPSLSPPPAAPTLLPRLPFSPLLGSGIAGVLLGIGIVLYLTALG